MNGPQKYYAKFKKPKTKKIMWYESIYVKHPGEANP